MKKEIQNIGHETLVDLLCTATYGSNWLACRINKGIRPAIGATDDDSREDLWAKALLAGYRIEAIDYYAEGDLYGNLGTANTTDEDGNGHYQLCLDDFKRGLQAAWDSTFKAHDDAEKTAAHRLVAQLLDDDDCCDQPEAETLMQIILFDELIYC